MKRLRTENDRFIATKSMDVLAKLDPAADDLHDARQWQFTPTAPLLAAVRSNTPVSDWITLLRESASPKEQIEIGGESTGQHQNHGDHGA